MGRTKTHSGYCCQYFSDKIWIYFDFHLYLSIT